MEIVFTASHWIYVSVLLVVVLTMVLKRDVVLPCIIGIFALGASYHGSLMAGIQTVFKALLTAGIELFDIMLVIALMVAMLKSIQTMGADFLMVSPLRPLMGRPKVAYWVLGGAMYAFALLFWPTPSTALVGVLLIPLAIQGGLPPMAAAMAVNIFGHGMALSGDLIIQGAPGLSETSASLPAGSMLNEVAVLSLITGIVAGTIAYFMYRKEFGKKPMPIELTEQVPGEDKAKQVEITGMSRVFAVIVPLVLLTIIAYMIFLPNPIDGEPIRGGAATAVLGGTAAVLLILAGSAKYGLKALEEVVGFIRDGLLFAVKIFAAVIPIAGFFLMGSEPVAQILGEAAPQFLFEIGTYLANILPLNSYALAFGNLVIGIITGLDGSGFSGLPLTGGLARALGVPAGVNVEALAAVGQMGAVWSGGGTLTAWAFGLVATAGVAGVKPIELARKNFIPVMVGLVVSTLVAIFLFM
jgi:hypothetical protein